MVKVRLLFFLLLTLPCNGVCQQHENSSGAEQTGSWTNTGFKVGLLAVGAYLSVKVYDYCASLWREPQLTRGGNKIAKTESSKSTALPSVCTKQQQIDSIKSAIARVEQHYNDACVTQYFNFKYLEDDLAKELVQHKKDYKTVCDLLKSIAADIKKQRMHIAMNRMRHMNIELKMAEQHKKVLAGLNKQLAELE